MGKEKQNRIAVLGAGIMGCSLALNLARLGAQVTLFDMAPQPFTAASRWNEGKIHLGYLYSADPSLRTAAHLLQGALLFRPLVEDLLSTSLEPVITQDDDFYLCHRRSVVSPDAMASYMQQVAAQVRTHPDARHYLADASQAQPRRLTATELGAITGSPDILAGFRVPERSVQTTWIADRFAAAVAAEHRIEVRMHSRITAARPLTDDLDGAWQVEILGNSAEPYDKVVNALWQGRMEIDATAGLPPVGVWTNRYRQSLFLRTREPVTAPCVIVATGPFGDIKNYNNRDFYLSWYADGLRTESTAVAPPDLSSLEMPTYGPLTASIFDHLEALLPWVVRLRENAERIDIEGGWVFAAGSGQLSNPAATLHQRSEYGVVRRGAYVSIDTGKYCTAPWVARAVAAELV
jgi:glycine/D-amino acid oxidase-like deaminating enzyme